MSDETLDFSKPEELQTRDGRAVRIYATDGNNAFPIHGAIKNDTRWCVATWTQNGRIVDDCMIRPSDLIRKPRRVTGWVNVYRCGDKYTTSDMYESKEKVKDLAAPQCIGQIYIDAEIQT